MSSRSNQQKRCVQFEHTQDHDPLSVTFSSSVPHHGLRPAAGVAAPLHSDSVLLHSYITASRPHI